MCEGLSDTFEGIKTNTDGEREYALHTVAVQAVGCRADERIIEARCFSVRLVEKTNKQQALSSVL